MDYVFFGTPRFAAIVLEQLIDAGFVPAAVVCNPDRPVGRRQVLTAPPVKVLIANRKAQSEILQPENVSTICDLLRAICPEFAIVAAYAKIIPKEVLAIPRMGTIGVHPSLLPKYRGATPIQSAILNGETETGITLYQMDDKIDHGAILAYRKAQIANGDTYESLEQKLAELGGKLLVATIPDFVAGKIAPQPQDHARATLTKKFTTADAEVNLKLDDPKLVWRKIRALNPEPGVYTMSYPGHEGKRVKLLRASFENGVLRILEIQVEGKNPHSPSSPLSFERGDEGE